jgi:hypothetical protein
MSKKEVLIDISDCGRSQNVYERGLNRHFGLESKSKCLRKGFYWTFRDVVEVKMSKKVALLDISGWGRGQNV